MKKECLLSKLKGMSQISQKNANKRIFYLKNGESIEEFPVLVCDPSFDSTFKIMFQNYPKRLMNLLNSIYFLDHGDKIIDLVVKYNEFPVISQKFNQMSAKMDLFCEFTLKSLKDKTKETYLDLEIQIGYEKELDKRLLFYGSETLKTHQNDVNDVISYVICLILPSNDTNANKPSSKIQLLEDEVGTNARTELEFIKIIKINIYTELMSILEKSSEQSCDDRDEWLKFLGLRFWCDGNDDDRYILPYGKLSHNNKINECFSELLALNNQQLNIIRQIEHYEENIEKKTQIICMFKSYKEFQLYPLFSKDYKEKEIRNILIKTTEVTNQNELKLIEEFINDYKSKVKTNNNK